MAMRVWFFIFSFLRCVALSERLSEIDVDVDAVGMLQLQTNELSHSQHQSTVSNVASFPGSASEVTQHITPNQVTTAIVTALITNAGLNQGEVEHFMSKLNLVALSNGLTEVLGHSSASGDLDGEIDMTLRFDPQAVARVVNTWLDNAQRELAQEGVETISDSEMLRVLATIRQGIAKSGLTFLETGASSITQRITKANGTYAVYGNGQEGPLEVNLRVSGSGLMGLFSSWLGDLATSFEEVGVRDAFIRAGLGPEEEEETREARHHPTVFLLGQKTQLSASSEEGRNSKELATTMVRAMLAEVLQRSQVHATDPDAAGSEGH